jgi:hypothetical protein
MTLRGWESELIGERIRALIVAESKIPREKLLSASRAGRMPFWRSVGMYLCVRSGISERDSGRIFGQARGNKAKVKIEKRVRKSPAFAREMARLEAMLGIGEQVSNAEA